jgi:hypothetical protein
MKSIELSFELEEEFFSLGSDNFFWDIFADKFPAPGESIEEIPSPIVSSKDLSMSPVSPVNKTALYRQEAIKRWRMKRDRRSFKKKIVCKARKDYAETRVRKGGRFVKSQSAGWVAITEVNHGV